MSKTINNDVVTGIGTIPIPSSLPQTLTTDPVNTTRINVQGPSLKNLLFEGDSIFANNELRRVKGFNPDGSIRIDVPFSQALNNEPLKRVENGTLREISISNDDAAITGSVNGKPCKPKKELTWRHPEGLAAVCYDTSGADFTITSTQR